MKCDRCKKNVPEFLWVGNDHPLLTDHPVTIHQQPMLDNPDEVKITAHAYVTTTMCSLARRPKRIFNWDSNTSVETAVGEALGAASVCWEKPEGAGVFNSIRASQITDELVEFFKEKWAT